MTMVLELQLPELHILRRNQNQSRTFRSCGVKLKFFEKIVSKNNSFNFATLVTQPFNN